MPGRGDGIPCCGFRELDVGALEPPALEPTAPEPAAPELGGLDPPVPEPLTQEPAVLELPTAVPAPGVLTELAAAPVLPTALALTGGGGGAGTSCRAAGSPQSAASPRGVATGRSPRQTPAPTSPSIEGGRRETGCTAEDFCGEGPPSTEGLRHGLVCMAARAVTGGMWLLVPERGAAAG